MLFVQDVAALLLRVSPGVQTPPMSHSPIMRKTMPGTLMP